MTDIAASQSKNLGPLVTASSVSLGGAASTIVIYLIQQLTHGTLPETVDEAIIVLVSAVTAYAAHRLTA